MQEENTPQRIKALLKEAGLKQVYLAEKLGIHRQAMNRLLSSEIAKSKYFPEIAQVLGVTEEYLLVGDKKGVLRVDEPQLKNLINNQFVLTDEDKARLEYWLINTNKDGCFFANKLKFDLNTDFPAGSLVVYATKLSEAKREGQIFMVLSAVNQSLVVGKYHFKEGLEYLINVHGQYSIQKSDRFIGVAVQINVYLGD